MNGVLVVDKPVGPTSHDVVAVARRALGTRRIGHTGTLDPLASGVLPLVIGRATRLARFLSSDRKTYVAGIRFGLATTTYDATGDPAGGTGEAPDPDALERALDRFRGTFEQMPPPYSAKKVAGTPAYKLARRGERPELKAVPVTVHQLRLLDADGTAASVEVVCSAGFYVRTLAHDLGHYLGCGAHLERLRRTGAGAFGLDGAVPLERLKEQGPAAAAALIPLADLLPDLPRVRLTVDGARRAAHGSPLTAADIAEEDVAGVGEERGEAGAAEVRLIGPEGTLLGIARSGAGTLHPVVVLV
jgi:tRNA pseudouridine55 synthase